MQGMVSYTQAAMERAMKVQEVILRAMAKKITWWQAAESLRGLLASVRDRMHGARLVVSATSRGSSDAIQVIGNLDSYVSILLNSPA
jgi:hypothetical protein